MGRAKKPTHLRAVEGTRDRRTPAEKAGEPIPINPLGPPPPGMTSREREVWNRVGMNLPAGMLRSVDEYILTAFCRAVAIADEATEMLRSPQTRKVTGEDGVTRDVPVCDLPLLSETPNGFLQSHAYLSIINKQALIIKTLGADLGLSPAARTRISVGGDAEENDPNAHYFAR